MKSQRIRPSELLKLRKETGQSYWDLVGNPLPTFDNGSDDVEALSPHPYTAKNIQQLRPFERFYTGADGKEQTVDQLAGLDHGADNHLYFAGELPEVVVRGSRKVAEDAIDAKLRKQQEYDQLNRLAWNIMLSRSLQPPKPIKVRIEPEEEWQPIEVYKHGKPSKRLYNRIAAWEGSDYAGQNAKLGGDAVGKFYEWTRNAVGDDIWNRLNQQQREALTSYRYNIKYDSFQPTINALHKWYNNPTSENLKAVRDSMNVGMDRKGYSGLRKRRLAEQAWFMEGIPYTNPDQIVIQPDATRVAKPIMQVSRLRTPFKTGGDVIIPAEDDYTQNPVEIPFRPSAQLPDLIDVYNHMFGTGLPTMNDGKDSGIHIKSSKRGTFTSAAKRHGMGVQEFANKVLSAPKGRYSSSMRKKANFARNAKSFKH